MMSSLTDFNNYVIFFELFFEHLVNEQPFFINAAANYGIGNYRNGMHLHVISDAVTR